jgi:hypothetical protein
MEKKLSEEHKRKLSIAHRGKILSDEHKNKIGLGLKGHKNSLGKHWKLSEEAKKNHSKPCTEENKKRMRESQLGTGNNNWKGGISRNKHCTAEYKQWRSNVFQRDNWTCQTCGIRGKDIEAHHIKKWADYPELRFELDNGITLCRECHKLTFNYRNNK